MPQPNRYRGFTWGLPQTSIGVSGRELLSALGSAVYAVKVPDGLIKIGYTSNPRNRIQSLGIGTSAMLALILNGTLADERAIHARLRGHAVKGREWYSDTDPAVLAVVDEMRAEMGIAS